MIIATAMGMMAARHAEPVVLIDGKPAVVETLTDSPFKEPGRNLLIVEESADRGTLPVGQRDILGSFGESSWRASWPHRIIDPTDTHANDLPKWQAGLEAVMNSGKKLPAMAISDGTKHSIIELPPNLVEFEALLSTFGGQP